ncbi:MAG: cytochrome C biogenesis protein [Legionellales bacterium]|jgi:cytochrome c-type biogenesis protein CcmH|nr:cytochrome C biogenesis protein [Legionellales bacterium]HBH11268.1 cytochrome C biogenesis protein [Gammaproteobacteria bacterium]|tara:strand:- start:58 stop:468 length:411 start_codon:yes stop_codon:yes gene_type:complete
MKMVYQFLFFGLVLITNNAYANNNPITFNNKNLEQRYYSLIEEIRCLVCQNQSLADSDAPLAQDLRNEIYKMIHSKKSNNQITNYLVERYGDFVLYRPPLKKNTWFLWFGPFLFLAIAFFIVFFVIRNQSRNETEN